MSVLCCYPRFQQTNANLKKKAATAAHPAEDFTAITRDDAIAFFAIKCIMDLYPRNNIHDYWIMNFSEVCHFKILAVTYLFSFLDLAVKLCVN